MSLSDWERSGPIDRTPETPGSDRNNLMIILVQSLPINPQKSVNWWFCMPYASTSLDLSMLFGIELFLTMGLLLSEWNTIYAQTTLKWNCKPSSAFKGFSNEIIDVYIFDL